MTIQNNEDILLTENSLIFFFFFFKIVNLGVGEMAYWLKALAPLPNDRSLRDHDSRDLITLF